MAERMISLEEFENLSEKLFEKIPKDSFDVILAIGRGGLVLGRYASDYFEKDMAVLMARRYKVGERKSDDVEVLFGEISHIGQLSGRILVVDDLLEDGITMKHVLNKLKGLKITDIKTAVLFVKPQSKITPNYFIEKTSDWIVFPYEKNEFRG
ncbi:MAG: phosphoribosyltransferase family protein [Nanoarchaeota archaeon]